MEWVLVCWLLVVLVSWLTSACAVFVTTLVGVVAPRVLQSAASVSKAEAEADRKAAAERKAALTSSSINSW